MRKTLFIYTETPLHAGSGVGLGSVDLPIQREKHTNYPIIQASGVKGALRDTLEIKLGRNNEALIKNIFGGATGEKGDDFAGAISPSDARILLFSVRALKGVFVWVTCPMVLARYQQETGLATNLSVPDLEKDVEVASEKLLINGQVMLEEFTYNATLTSPARDWAEHFAEKALANAVTYWKTRLSNHLVILPDNEFRDFVRYSTEIVTRIHIDDVKKTVKDGQLFSQELLPADSLLYSVINVTNSRNAEANLTDEQVSTKLVDELGARIQIGADETVGRGRVLLGWA